MKNVMTIALVAGTLLLFGCDRGEITEEYRYSKAVTAQLTRVEADIDAADLIIEPTSTGKASVDVDVEYWWWEADFKARIDGNTLVVDLVCRPTCRGDVVVRVPHGVSVDADSGSGDIEISDLDGDIQAHVGSGTVRVDNVVGDLELESGSGSVVGKGLDSARCEARAGSGSVKLEFAGAPRDIQARTGSGSVKIAVPKGRYNIALSVGSGHMSTDGLIDDPDAPRTIEARAGSGNVSVRGF